MDITALTQNASAQQTSLGQQVGNHVLREALDMQQSSAQQLIESVPSAPSATAGSLGGRVDEYA